MVLFLYMHTNYICHFLILQKAVQELRVSFLFSLGGLLSLSWLCVCSRLTESFCLSPVLLSHLQIFTHCLWASMESRTSDMMPVDQLESIGQAPHMAHGRLPQVRETVGRHHGHIWAPSPGCTKFLPSPTIHLCWSLCNQSDLQHC